MNKHVRPAREPRRTLTNLSRRDFLAATGGLGLASVLGACGTSDPSSSAITTSTTSVPPRVGLSTIPDPTAALVTRWKQDPFARGSYAYLGVDAKPGDRSILGAPGARRFFAGEATDRDFPATVHGALFSGQRAAEEIVASGATSVVIVGAGASGLGAAAALEIEGLGVTVVEARDRIGGRVWSSFDNPLGVPLDLGASWIHGQRNNPLVDLADSIDAQRVPTNYSNYLVRDADGDFVPDADLSRDYLDVTNVELEYAADIELLSNSAEVEGESIVGGDVLMPDGYVRLLEPLLGDYPVLLETVVDRIETTGTGARVFAGDNIIEADAVLITVPLGVLKAGDIEFTPPISAERNGAIDRLGMGLLDKVYLRFDEVFWDVDVDLIGYQGNPRGYFAEWYNFAKYIDEPVLLAFNAASDADELDELSDEEIVAEAMTVLRAMYQLG